MSRRLIDIDDVRPYTEEELYPSGALRERRHYFDKRLHCDDGPAREGFREDGTLEFREWRIHGKRHRLGGPAYKEFHRDGTLLMHTWSEDGKRHRIDGPAEEWFTPDGRVKTAGYYINNKRLSKAEHHRLVRQYFS